MTEEKGYVFPFATQKAVLKGASGAVSSNSYYATKAGLEILEQGGTAFDAAVAVSLTLSVTEPHHSGIGGGAFALLYSANEGKTVALDARGDAPKAADRDIFIKDGQFVNDWATFGGKSVLVPGLYRSLDKMLKEYGTMSWQQVSAPAIRTAREGFRASYVMGAIVDDLSVQKKHDATKEFRNLYYKKDGSPYRFGELIKNPEIADTMEEIAAKGVDFYYKGQLADDIVKAVQENGGVLAKEDMAGYDVQVKEPLRGSYRGYEIATMPPPSSGVIILEMLNILENFDLSAMGQGSADSIHAIAETMKAAFADRSVGVGDPRFVKVNVDLLSSKEFAKERFACIDMKKAQSFAPAEQVDCKDYPGNTTHFVVIDKAGNIVTQTQTVRDWYGSGVVVKGRGFVMNNTMADFSPRAGIKTTQGLTYGESNSIQGGKSPLSSKSPSIIFKDGKPLFAVGSAGGPRIVTSILQCILNILDYGILPDEAIKRAKLTSFTQEQGLELEPGVSPDTVAELKKRGHLVCQCPEGYALTMMLNSIAIKDGLLYPGMVSRVDGCAGVLFDDNSSGFYGICY